MRARTSAEIPRTEDLPRYRLNSKLWLRRDNIPPQPYTRVTEPTPVYNAS